MTGHPDAAPRSRRRPLFDANEVRRVASDPLVQQKVGEIVKDPRFKQLVRQGGTKLLGARLLARFGGFTAAKIALMVGAAIAAVPAAIVALLIEVEMSANTDAGLLGMSRFSVPAGVLVFLAAFAYEYRIYRRMKARFFAFIIRNAGKLGIGPLIAEALGQPQSD